MRILHRMKIGKRNFALKKQNEFSFDHREYLLHLFFMISKKAK